MKQFFLWSIVCLVWAVSISRCDIDSSDIDDIDGDDVAEYVDIGLPSGTKWKTKNETNPNCSCVFFAYRLSGLLAHICPLTLRPTNSRKIAF